MACAPGTASHTGTGDFLGIGASARQLSAPDRTHRCGPGDTKDYLNPIKAFQAGAGARWKAMRPPFKGS